MSIASEITALTTDRNNIRTALVNKGVTAASSHGFDDFAEDIASITAGGSYTVIETPDSHGGTVLQITTDDIDLSNDTVTPEVLHSGYTAHDASGTVITGTYVEPYIPVVEKMVNFYDYNGQLVYSYSVSEFNELTEMPPVPSHIGLTAQGWNWTLADAKTEVATSGVLDIGAHYITSDGKTRLYVNIYDSTLLNFYLLICVNGSAAIDWGDGTAVVELTGSSVTSSIIREHTYSTTGNYVISVYPLTTTARIGLYNTSASSSGFIRFTAAPASTSYEYHLSATAILRKVEIGERFNLGYGAFYNCTNLSTITIPSYINQGFESYLFYNCQSLEYITIPQGVTSCGSNSFNKCFRLKKVSFPKSCTTIPNSCFPYCYSLSTLYLPSNITTLGDYTFQYCYGLQFFKMSNCTRIPSYGFYYCKSLKSVIVSPNLTQIADRGFYGCESLTDFSCPNSVTTISSYAFQECKALKLLNIPTNASYTTIASYSFYQCTCLLKLTIPSNVTAINAYSLNYLYNLRELHFLGTTPPTISGTSVYSGLPSTCKIYVPTGRLSTYTSTSNYPSSSTYTYIEE